MQNPSTGPYHRNARLYIGAAAAVLVAAGLGFGVAKITSPRTLPEAVQPENPAADAPKTLTLTPEAMQQAGIVVETVRGGGLSSEILTQGAVVSSPTGQAVITSRTGGMVTRIFKRLGDPVKAGETLALVSSNDAAQIAADRRSAAARSNLAQQTLVREKSLFDQGITPRAAYEQALAEAEAAKAEAARASIAATNAGVTADGRGARVVSPINGHITAAMASLGAFVSPEMELFRVADPAKTDIQAPVSATDAARLKAGDRVVIETGEGPPVEGRLRSVTPALDAQTRTATAVIDAPAAALAPGRTVRVRLFVSAPESNAIVVPEEAVQSLEDRQVVFVRTNDGFKSQTVVTGQRSAGRIEIISGLAAGSAIATKNAFLLKAEIGKSAEED